MTPLGEACRAVMALVERAGEHSAAPLDSDELVVYLREMQELANLGETGLDLLCGEGGALDLLEEIEDELFYCPICDEGNPKHTSDCKFAAFLRRAAEELGA